MTRMVASGIMCRLRSWIGGGLDYASRPLIISPFARRGFVDHTFYDTTSILKMIEVRYGLTPLGERDAHANDLLNILDLYGPAH
jgi:Phosphoesterase family